MVVTMFWMLLILPFMSAQPSYDSIYASEIKECAKNIDSLPKNISAIFDIKIVKNHIELIVFVDDDKLDYYEMNWKEYCCYKATGLNELPARTEEDQADCDDIEEKEGSYFHCAYKLINDKYYSIIVIKSNKWTNEADVYTVNKQTGVIDYRNYMPLKSNFDLRFPHDGSDDTDEFLMQINECLDKKKEIPKNLPISFDITKRDHHIEILAYYENKYDFYKINWEGVSCHREMGEYHKPNETMESDDKRCDNRPLSTDPDYGIFRCAYHIWTTEYDETIFEEFKKVDTTIAFKTCSKKKLKLPEHLPIKFEILPRNRSIEIFLTYQNKTDYYEVDWNGSVISFEARLDEITVKQSEELPVDDKIEFHCPYLILDDRDYAIIVIKSRSRTEDEITDAHVYFINKETFEVNYDFYPSYEEYKLEVPQSKKDENPEFDHDIESCVNRRSLIPSALNASIGRINNHVRITLNYDEKYDYYEMNYRGLH